MKLYDHDKELPYLKCKKFDVNFLYGWAMSQKLRINDLKWVKGLSEFDESFVKSYSRESDEGFFLEVDI